jgi:hypothetical protein
MSPITALLIDQECTYANGRMAAIANALTHKYALVRTHESLALIHSELYFILYKSMI